MAHEITRERAAEVAFDILRAGVAACHYDGDMLLLVTDIADAIDVPFDPSVDFPGVIILKSFALEFEEDMQTADMRTDDVLTEEILREIYEEANVAQISTHELVGVRRILLQMYLEQYPGESADPRVVQYLRVLDSL